MNNALSFLKNAVVEEVKSTPRAGGGRSKQWNPNPTWLAVRLWADGSVFPSQAAVDKFNLEYPLAVITKEEIKLSDDALAKAVEKAGDAAKVEPKYKNIYSYPNGTNNGFDVVDSREWAQYKADGNVLFISPSPKDSPKLDLFSTVSYTDAGDPKLSVLDQGSATYGKEVLIPAVNEIYGTKISEELPEGTAPDGINREYIDLVIVENLGDLNIPKHFDRPFYLFPKKISRGDKAGESTYVRREGTKVYLLLPAEQVYGEQKEEVTEPAEEVQA